MNAMHINWTKPFFMRNDSEYRMEDFDILTTVLSALKWREKNGHIKMVTDSEGKEFYIKNGMECLWDKGIEAVLDGIKENANMFWAAGKLHALSREAAPIAVLDTDFIVWDEILFDKLPALTVIHDEELYSDVYPDMASFKMKDSYRFDPCWNQNLKALNTAFLVIKDNDLLSSYTRAAIKFMNNACECDDQLTYMVFAEQRLLHMEAVRMGRKIKCLSTLEKLFKNGDGYFTHIWGMKQQMRDNSELRNGFCRRCISRIVRDFPEYEPMLRNIEVLSPYFEDKEK